MNDNKCQRPACTSKLPAAYGFLSDPPPKDLTDIVEVHYCAPCTAFCITQDYFTSYEVNTLFKLQVQS